MKKTFISVFILFLLSNWNFINAQVPSLVERTLNGNLKTSDFENRSSYMFNVDTIDHNCFMCGEITWYKTKKELIDKIDNSLSFLKGKKVDYLKILENNLVYSPRKLHYYAEIGNFRIDWWFSEKGVDKLETITLTKI